MTDDQHLITQGEDTPELESGDDLAERALAQANQTQLPATGVTGDQVAETLSSLQNIIERNAIELDRINEELKLVKDSLKSIFENDTTLAEAEEKAATVTQQVKERKSQLQSTLEVNQLKNQSAELTERKKEVQAALNNHLLNLYKLTGAQVVDTSEGQREFEVKANLKSKKSGKDE